MWSFLGNGFNVIENEADRDITWYLGDQEKEVDMERVREVMKGFLGRKGRI